jgi:hypothetical protein
MPETAERTRLSNGYAIAGLVAGILDQAYNEFVPGHQPIDPPTVILVVLALVLSSIGIRRARRGAPGIVPATVGLTCGLLTLADFLIRVVVVLALL